MCKHVYVSRWWPHRIIVFSLSGSITFSADDQELAWYLISISA